MTETVDTLKQRLVGAFVLISLAVIFLPMIFDEPHEQQSNIIVSVPPQPSFHMEEIEFPVKPEFQRLEFSLNEHNIIETGSKVEESTSTVETQSDDNKVSQESVQVAYNVVESPTVAEKPAVKEKQVVKEKLTVAEKPIVAERPKDPSNPVLKPKEKSNPDTSNLPIFKNVWMVKLGTFSQAENAYQLRDRLRKDGFEGHTKSYELNGLTAVQVFTGPFVDKKQAEKIKTQVDKKYNIKSRVIFFDA